MFVSYYVWLCDFTICACVCAYCVAIFEQFFFLFLKQNLNYKKIFYYFYDWEISAFFHGFYVVCEKKGFFLVHKRTTVVITRTYYWWVSFCLCTFAIPKTTGIFYSELFVVFDFLSQTRTLTLFHESLYRTKI